MKILEILSFKFKFVDMEAFPASILYLYLKNVLYQQQCLFSNKKSLLVYFSLMKRKGIFGVFFGNSENQAYREVRFGSKVFGEQPIDVPYCDNSVTTAKYNIISFLPRYFVPKSIT